MADALSFVFTNGELGWAASDDVVTAFRPGYTEKIMAGALQVGDVVRISASEEDIMDITRVAKIIVREGPARKRKRKATP